MSRKRNRNRKTMDSHPLNFSKVDLLDVAQQRAKWLDNVHPLDFLCVEKVRTSLNDATRGAFCELQWLWEQLEPADAILATCVDRRATALRKIPWDVVKKSGLTDAEDLLAESQLRTVTDFCNALENLEEAIAAFGQASFRGYRHVQLYETEYGDLRFNVTDNWNWARDGYSGPWQWNPDATFGLTIGKPLPVDQESIISRVCPRPIDQPAMMLCLDRKNAKAQWLTYNGRYGVPPIFAIMPPGISEEVRKLYIEFARQCVSNAAGVLPAGSDVKAITPGVGGPDTFRLAIEQANQELVLRATGGLMTMLTAPGAGTNTETGSTHQDAFDDLADAEAHAIAAIIQERVIVPIIEQWHPGQPVLVEFELKRPDRDDSGMAVQNITALAQMGYRVSDEDVQAMTGLKVNSANMDSTAIYAAKAAGYTPTLAAMEDRMGMPLKPVPVMEPSAVNSLEKRYAPLMLWGPARKAFERACNAVRRAAEDHATAARAEGALTERELDAFREMIGRGIDPEKLAEEAREAQRVLGAAVRGNLQGAIDNLQFVDSARREVAVANNSEKKRKCRAKDPSKCPYCHPDMKGDQDRTRNPEDEDKKPEEAAGAPPESTASSASRDEHPTNEWHPITAPPTITPQEATERLKAGIKVRNPLGDEVTLDETLLKHWKAEEESARKKNKEPKAQGDINARLSRLPLIEEVIRHPHEIWERANENGLVSHTYLAKVLEADREKGQGFMVAFTKTGDTATLETYYINKRVTSSKRTGRRIWPKR